MDPQRVDNGSGVRKTDHDVTGHGRGMAIVSGLVCQLEASLDTGIGLDETGYPMW